MLNTAYLFDAPWENGRGFRRFDPLWHAQARRRVKRKKTLQVKVKIQSTCHIFTRPVSNTSWILEYDVFDYSLVL